MDFESYALGLKTTHDELLVSSRRRTFVIGFILTSRSALALSRLLLSKTVNPYDYFLTFKLSQDHIETLFSKIRRMGGHNNNPTTVQFQSAMKRLIVKQCIAPSKFANTMDIECSSSVFALKWSRRTSSMIDVGSNENLDLSLESCNEGTSAGLTHCLPMIQSNIIYYIAGFIVRQLAGSVKCPECSDLLTNNQLATVQDDHAQYCMSFTGLLDVKNKGGLIQPSSYVYEALVFAERQFHANVSRYPSSTPKLLSKLIIGALTSVYEQSQRFFPRDIVHSESVEVAELCHEQQLLRQLFKQFYKIRLRHYSREINKKSMGNQASDRSRLNRLTIFKHQ